MLVPRSAAWTTWNLDPVVLVSLVAVLVLYGRGLARLAGRRRRVVSAAQAAAFLTGMALLGLALLSPLEALDATLLSAHMAQHLILLVVAPPLLVYGRPGLVLMLGLPRPVRLAVRQAGATRLLRPVARLGANPLVVLGLVTACLWGWHLPALYGAAVRNPAVHALEHLSFLASSLAYWRLVIDPQPRRRLDYGGAMVMTFGVLLQSAALGAVITFSPTVLYPVYRAGAALWRVDALGDQQLAGALMWIPPGGLYLITVLVLAWRGFRDVERRVGASRPIPAAVTPR